MSPFCPTCGESIEYCRSQCAVCGHLKEAVTHHEILQRHGGVCVVHTFRCRGCFPTRWESFKRRVGRLLGGR